MLNLYYLDHCTFLQGCVDEIKKYAKDHMLIIGGIAIGVGAIQVSLSFLSVLNLKTECDVDNEKTSCEYIK